MARGSGRRRKEKVIILKQGGFCGTVVFEIIDLGRYYKNFIENKKIMENMESPGGFVQKFDWERDIEKRFLELMDLKQKGKDYDEKELKFLGSALDSISRDNKDLKDNELHNQEKADA